MSDPKYKRKNENCSASNGEKNKFEGYRRKEKPEYSVSERKAMSLRFGEENEMENPYKNHQGKNN